MSDAELDRFLEQELAETNLDAVESEVSEEDERESYFNEDPEDIEDVPADETWLQFKALHASRFKDVEGLMHDVQEMRVLLDGKGEGKVTGTQGEHEKSEASSEMPVLGGDTSASVEEAVDFEMSAGGTKGDLGGLPKDKSQKSVRASLEREEEKEKKGEEDLQVRMDEAFVPEEKTEYRGFLSSLVEDSGFVDLEEELAQQEETHAAVMAKTLSLQAGHEMEREAEGCEKSPCEVYMVVDSRDVERRIEAAEDARIREVEDEVRRVQEEEELARKEMEEMEEVVSIKVALACCFLVVRCHE